MLARHTSKLDFGLKGLCLEFGKISELELCQILYRSD